MVIILIGLFLAGCSKEVYTQNKVSTQIPCWVPCQRVTLISHTVTERKETASCTYADGKQLVLIKEQVIVVQCNYTYKNDLYYSTPWSEVHTTKQALENCH